MNASTQTTMRYEQERLRLCCTLALLQIELAQVQAELEQVRARCNAYNRNVFTIVFVGGQIALLDVRGAANVEEARHIARTAIKHCQYTVVDGDQSDGHAAYFYLWCSTAAQEVQPHSH